jgi:hypothetical protein
MKRKVFVTSTTCIGSDVDFRGDKRGDARAFAVHP